MAVLNFLRYSLLSVYAFKTVSMRIRGVGEIMKDGFEMGNIWYNEPNTLDTAFDVIGDIILSTAAQQYGKNCPTAVLKNLVNA